jgi:EpsI family protein
MLARSLVIAILMFAASAGAGVMRPTIRVADLGPKLDLEAIVPRQFGDWREEPQPVAQVVNPQQKELLDRIYAHVLGRTYVNARGYRIMLSIAYGGEQNDNSQVHKPEICYPAQGFQIWRNEAGVVATRYGEIPVKRLLATLNQRREPITYWTTIGEQAVRNGIHKKLVEMSYGLTGKIPDGLLFRVSSIDADAGVAYTMHQNFIDQLLDAAGPDARKRLSGVASASREPSQ